MFVVCCFWGGYFGGRSGLVRLLLDFGLLCIGLVSCWFVRFSWLVMCGLITSVGLGAVCFGCLLVVLGLFVIAVFCCFLDVLR